MKSFHHLRGAALAAAVALATAGVARAQDHPFTLVNVVDLYELFAPSVTFDTTFDPITSAPPNWAAYSAAPRVGTNPAVVATDGTRAWIGGYYNGPNFHKFLSTAETNRAAWYASVGVAEVRNISTQSGYGGDWVRYMGTFQLGPGIRNTDWMSGMDYDPNTQRLYIAYDAINPLSALFLPNAGLPWQNYETFIAAVDANSASPTYGQTFWKRINPVQSEDPGDPLKVRAHAGVSLDSLNPNWLGYPMQGFGRIAFFDVTNPFAAPIERYIADFDALGCTTTGYRGHDFHPITGEWYGRLLNGVQWVRRDTTPPAAPYKVYSRFIREPSAGGNGTADTAASGDDVQLVPVNDPVSPSQDIVGVGPNGLLDTTPAGDDLFSTNAIVTARVLGNSTGTCPDDPNGWDTGANPQGQGMGLVPSGNLVSLSQDLMVANNRPNAGSGQLTEIKFFDLQGNPVANLPIPCAPVAGTGTGVAIYDFDYDPTSGTLVVVEFERRLMYVYKAQRIGDQPYPRYDFTRNRRLDLADFAGFQQCYTGAEVLGPQSLNCQRMNTDADCDIDFVDYAIFQTTWDAGPGP